MAYWLVKSEPGSWPWSDHAKAAKDEWTGVRNPQARVHLKAMKKGDRVFFYHTGGEKAVVGISEVVGEAHPDSTDPDWTAVDLRAVEPVTRPVSLAEIKSDPALKEMVLARYPRLSVQPVTDAEWKRVLKMADAKS